MPTAPKEVEINEKSHCGINDRRADVLNFVCSVCVGINVVVLVLADHRFIVFINISSTLVFDTAERTFTIKLFHTDFYFFHGNNILFKLSDISNDVTGASLRIFIVLTFLFF